MNNNEFLEVLRKSYLEYLRTGSRSNAKLVILHGAIARDLQQRLGREYVVRAFGIGDGRETFIHGYYMNKKVDITVYRKERELGGIAVKFIMTNYAQNSNNYFESMLGETANIRCCDGKKYYHIVILPRRLPYFGSRIIDGVTQDVIIKEEKITQNNLNKYIVLSNDDIMAFLHSPNKTLLYTINTTDKNFTINQSRQDWVKNMQREGVLHIAENNDDLGIFGNSIIRNNYEVFITRVMHGFMEM